MGLGSKAHYLYGQSNTVGVISAIPRSKFNFTVSMRHINPAAQGGLTTTLFERISSISMPGYSVKAQTLNQYNKKRVVQTGIDYAPISMLAYDTRDGVFEQFLKEYSEYYYAGSMNYGPSFIGFRNASAGTKLNEKKNFIDTLVINRVNTTEDNNTIKIYNPMITNIDADTLDYSDSGLVQYRITFIYEGYDINTNDYVSPQKKPTYEDRIVRENKLRQRQDESQPVTSPAEPVLDTPPPVDNENVKDSRFDDKLGMTESELNNLSDEERQAITDSGEYVFVAEPPGSEPVLERKDDQRPVGQAIGPNDLVTAPDGSEVKGVALDNGPSSNQGVAVDNSSVTSSEVIAEDRDSAGNVTSRVVKETGVDEDGFEYTETKRVPVEDVEYRKYDQYVGQPIESIPPDVMEEIENSYAYRDAGDGTLENFADAPTHDEIMSTIVTPDEGFTDYDQRSNEHIGYNATLNEYERFDNAQDAVQFAKSGSTEPVIERFTGPGDDDRKARVAKRLADKRRRRQARREEMGEDAYQAMLDKYRPVSQKTGQVDEATVMSQSVAPSMSEAEMREQGSSTPMPLPNPDLIAKADSFDSDGDPKNNYVESDSFETDPDPYEDITDEYLNED